MSNRHSVTIPFFIAHAGCPHRCIFCDQNRISGASGSLPTAADIAECIDRFSRTADGRRLEVAFFGGSFTLLPATDRRALFEGVRPFLHNGMVSGVRISTRPDAVPAETVAELAANGVTTVELGVQSFNDDVLDRAERGYRGNIIAESVGRLHAGGIAVGIQLMAGLPGDTPEKCLDGMREAISLRPAFFRLYPALVIEGTELASRYRSGSFVPWELETAAEVTASMLAEAYRAGIPVVRVGLQPTADLDRPGTVLAGPYHQAFRDLAEGVLRRRAMTTALSGAASANVTFVVPPAELSWYAGHRRCNLHYFTGRGVSVSLTADAVLGRHTCRVERGGVSRIINILEEQ